MVLEPAVVRAGGVGPRPVERVDDRRTVRQQRGEGRPVQGVVVDHIEVPGPEVGGHGLEYVVFLVDEIGRAEPLVDRRDQTGPGL